MDDGQKQASSLRHRLSDMKTKLRHSHHIIRQVPQDSGSPPPESTTVTENTHPLHNNNINNNVSQSPARPVSVPASIVPRTQTMPSLAVEPGLPPSLNHAATTPPVTGDPVSPNRDQSPWIGGTGLGNTGLGKSGRVIERLMAENDRLRREMKAELVKREELQRTVQNQKPKLEQLQSENARLANIKAMDDNIIQRRDRKIEELKNDLDNERQKRNACEQRAQDAEQRREESEETSRIEIQSANEQCRHATVHAEILQTSHQQLAREYKQRVARTIDTIKDLSEERDEDRRRMARLDIVTSQMRQESETLRRQFVDLTAVWHRYQNDKEEQFVAFEADASAIHESAMTNQDRNDALQTEVQDLKGRMRWLMNLDKLRSAPLQSTPTPSPSPPIGPAER